MATEARSTGEAGGEVPAVAITPVHRALLACGIAYGVATLIANDVVAAMLYDGYSRADQAVSELSAEGSPARTFLIALGPLFFLLLAGFGIGVRESAVDNRSLRITGTLLVAQAFFAVLWTWFPMSARDDIVPGTTTANDTGHLLLAAGSVLFLLAQMGFSAAALDRRFKIYVLATVVVSLAFGMLASAQAVNLADGKATPLMGLYERANIGAWLLWMAVLAVTLLREGPVRRLRSA
jgi:hypothetical protein